VDHTFNYQGELLDNNVAITDTFNFTIQAYSDSLGTVPIGDLAEYKDANAVLVTKGLFNLENVDLGLATYDGMDIWLQISVKKPADVNYTALTPLQKMQSVPYATTLIDKGATQGQVLTFNDTSGWQPADAVAPPNCDQNNQSLQYNASTGWACVNNHRNYVWTTGSTNTDPFPIGTSWTDMPDLDINPISITTTGGDIRFGWNGTLWCQFRDTGRCAFYFRILVDGSGCGNQTTDSGFGYVDIISDGNVLGNGDVSNNYNVTGICSVTAGTHNLRLQYKLTNADMQFRHFSGKFLLWAEEL
jgi:hypothetical protein